MADSKPETKAARDIEAGDWVTFGSMAWQAGEPVPTDHGTIVIMWGNGSTSEFQPDERLTMDYSN